MHTHTVLLHLLLCCIPHVAHIVHVVQLSYKATRCRVLRKVNHELATYVHWTITYTVLFHLYYPNRPVAYTLIFGRQAVSCLVR